MVLAVVDDLLFSSKIRAVAGGVGRTAIFVRDRAAILASIRANKPDLVIFDLDRAELDPIGAVREIRAQDDIKHVKLIGFASHVNVDVFKTAREAGIDVALARSAFVTDLPALIRGQMGHQPNVTP
jgi:CheY-like chemotaxis protein